MKKFVFFLLALFSLTALAKVPEVPDENSSFEFTDLQKADTVSAEVSLKAELKIDPGIHQDITNDLQDLKLNLVSAASKNSDIRISRLEINRNQERSNSYNRLSRPLNKFKDLHIDPGWRK